MEKGSVRVGIKSIFFSKSDIVSAIKYMFGREDMDTIFAHDEECRPGFYSIGQMERDRNYIRRHPL